MIDPISIPEAAALLGISPSRVHALVADGQVPAVKLGGRWLIERSDAERRRRTGGLKGRPFAPHNAWALLRLASGEDVEGIDPSVRSRMRKAIATEGLEQLAPRLLRRGERHRFGAHRGEIHHIVDDPHFLASGVSAAAAYGLDLVPGHEADGYVRAGALQDFVAEHALQPDGPTAAVLLRVVPDRAWGFSGRVAPLAAVALDLTEDADPRSAAAGREALNALRSR